MRFIALDVHRDFCEVAIAEGGQVRLAGRVETTPAGLELFAQSLGADDQVVLEATGNALAIARVIEPHVARVVLANPKAVKGVTQTAKTDKLDARTLAQLLAAGFLPEVWTPDERTRALRRRISRRAQLVRQRTREKNQIHAILIRNLKARPPVTDLFGVQGRKWLSEQGLPGDEREMVEACLRGIDFLDREVAAIDRTLAELVLASPEMRRLMTLPGVNFVTAAGLLAAIGDAKRFPTARHLVSYLGLDPRVRQSGSEPARHGRISKQGPGEARHVLVEAAWHAARTTGPLLGAERTSPPSPSHASSQSSPGTCSPAGRTTPSSGPRSYARRSAASSSWLAPSDAKGGGTPCASSQPASSTGSRRSSPHKLSSHTDG